MKRIMTGTVLALLLTASGGYAETNQTAVADVKHPAACPHCGFVQTNQPAAVSVPAARDWKSSVYGGFSAQSGNVVTKSYNYGGEFSRIGKLYRSKAKADGKYSETEDQVTASKTEASGEMRRMLDARWFTYGIVSALHDGLKEISYRVKAGPGLGYYFVDSKALTVDVSSGPLYVVESKADSQSGYLAWRFAQGIDWQITDTFRWWTSAEAVVDTTDTAAYTVAFKTGIESKLNSRVSLLVVMEDDYDSQPEAKGNIEKNDFQVSTGLRYTF